MLTKTVTAHTVERWHAWDNYNWHADQLRQVGATEDDLAPLRAATEVWAAAEKAVDESIDPAQPDADLLDLQQPLILACGWSINPPTKAARTAAARAVFSLTTGVPSEEGMQAIVGVALWILWQWGLGRANHVMRLFNTANALAELQLDIPERLLAEGETWDNLSTVYMRLMGIPEPSAAEKKTLEATVNFHQTLRLLQSTLCARGNLPTWPILPTPPPSCTSPSTTSGTASPAPSPTPSCAPPAAKTPETCAP